MEFQWTKTREKAALLVADGKLSEPEIAKSVGISQRTLAYWKVDETFKARVAEHVEAARKALKAKGIAEKLNRLTAYNDRWQRMQQVIKQRAKVYADVKAGGETGLLVKQIKGIGKGEDFQVVEEYAVDTGLLKEMREHEKQAAQELGQWTERREITGKDGAPLTKTDLASMSNDELTAIAKARGIL